MRSVISFSIFFFFTALLSLAQNSYPDNETGQYEDLLTPPYYNSTSGSPFREATNTFVHFARLIPFQHPLQDSLGNIPSYSTPANGEFGAGKGPTGTEEHHPAIDMHVGSNETHVNLYASHDGYLESYRDADKYRHYISIRTEVRDSVNNFLGFMLTIYGHVDLDLDSAEGLEMNEQWVQKGDLISKNLYAGTVGGAHMHYEIRYYRAADTGYEIYYGTPMPGDTAGLSVLSTGSWSYGYWNPTRGYGFANPVNHFTSTTNIQNIKDDSQINVYPNPCLDILYIDVPLSEAYTCYLINAKGQVLYCGNNCEKISVSAFENGIYQLVIVFINQTFHKRIVKQ